MIAAPRSNRPTRFPIDHNVWWWSSNQRMAAKRLSPTRDNVRFGRQWIAWSIRGNTLRLTVWLHSFYLLFVEKGATKGNILSCSLEARGRQIGPIRSGLRGGRAGSPPRAPRRLRPALGPIAYTWTALWLIWSRLFPKRAKKKCLSKSISKHQTLQLWADDCSRYLWRKKLGNSVVINSKLSGVAVRLAKTNGRRVAHIG